MGKSAAGSDDELEAVQDVLKWVFGFLECLFPLKGGS
jgi:hypothetical protein